MKAEAGITVPLWLVVVYKMRESAVLGGSTKLVVLVNSWTLRMVPGFNDDVLVRGGRE